MAKWGSCDFRQLQDLQERINKYSEKIGLEKFCEDCAKELAARLYAKVVHRTPTGRKPKFDAPKTVKVKVRGTNGRPATRSYLTKEGAILKQYWSGYIGGTLKKAWAVSDVEKHGDTYTVTVFNPTEYAMYVEHGHRQRVGRYVPALGKKLKKGWVEGKHMLAISEKELQGKSDAIIERMLQEKLEEIINGE